MNFDKQAVFCYVYFEQRTRKQSYSLKKLLHTCEIFMDDLVKNDKEEDRVDYVEVPTNPGQFPHGTAEKNETFLSGGSAERGPSPNYIVGGTTGKGGEPRGAFMAHQDAKNLDAVRAQLAEEEHRHREKKYAIPEDVPKQSATHVHYELRNTIYGEEEKDFFNDRVASQQRDERIRLYSREQAILEDILDRDQRQFIAMAERAQGAKASYQEIEKKALERAHVLPAAVALQEVNMLIKDWSRDTHGAALIQGQMIPRDDALNAAMDLQRRLAHASGATESGQENTTTPPQQARQKASPTAPPARTSAETSAQRVIPRAQGTEQRTAAQSTPERATTTQEGQWSRQNLPPIGSEWINAGSSGKSERWSITGYSRDPQTNRVIATYRIEQENAKYPMTGRADLDFFLKLLNDKKVKPKA